MLLLTNNEMQPFEKYLLSILVQNNSGLLARVASLFGRRGYNIDSLNVSATNDPSISRITMVVHGNEEVLSLISKQVKKLEEVISVYHLLEAKSFCRELLLVKLEATVANRGEIFDLIKVYDGRIVDLSRETLIAEVVGNPSELDNFQDIISDFKILEISRTGVTALEKINK